MFLRPPGSPLTDTRFPYSTLFRSARAPLPLDAGRRTEDLPLLALPACLSTLEMKPWPRFFGALGRMRNSSSRRSVMAVFPASASVRSEEHTSELQSLMRISYAVFCLKKKRRQQTNYKIHSYT